MIEYTWDEIVDLEVVYRHDPVVLKMIAFIKENQIAPTTTNLVDDE